MAKQANYSIMDREYFFLMGYLCDKFEKANLPAVIVGGAAAQAHVAKALSKRFEDNISRLVKSEKLNPRDNIRLTDDIYLVTLLEGVEKDDGRQILKVVRTLDGQYSTDDDIYEIKVERLGARSPKLSIESLNSKIENLGLDISYAPEHLERLAPENYRRFYEAAEDMELEYDGSTKARIKIVKPEHLIAAKLSRDSPKDKFDVYSVAQALAKNLRYLDMKEIKGILYPEFEEQYNSFESEYERLKSKVE